MVPGDSLPFDGDGRSGTMDCGDLLTSEFHDNPERGRVFSIISSVAQGLIDRCDEHFRGPESASAKLMKLLCSKRGEEYLVSTEKRILDVTVSLPLSIVVAPGILILASLNKMKNGGQMFYVQERLIPLGTQEREDDVFGVIKIRTMVESADDQRGLMLQDGYDERFDPRVTKFGRFLRKYKLDELPQLIQVLRGQMSLSGIRATPQYVYEHMCQEWGSDRAVRHLTGYLSQRAPGLSGLNQVCNEDAKINDRRYWFDRYYVENASLGLDVYVLWLTFLHLVRTRPGRYPRGRVRFRWPDIPDRRII